MLMNDLTRAIDIDYNDCRRECLSLETQTPSTLSSSRDILKFLELKSRFARLLRVVWQSDLIDPLDSPIYKRLNESCRSADYARVKLLQCFLPYSRNTETFRAIHLYTRSISNIKLILCLFMLIIGISSGANAANLGVRGVTFKIAEEDLLEGIQNKLAVAQMNGELLQFQEKMKTDLKDRLDNPEAVSGIITTVKQRSWLYDPSISLDRDLSDQDGRIFYTKGTKVNPLDSMTLTKGMLFIDGRDEEQVAWALGIKKENKIVLVGGSAIGLMRSTKSRFYYDTKGKITGKFGIKQVPASMFQEGNMLRITEVRL